MYNKQNIIYKNTPICTVNDLKSLLSSKEQDYTIGCGYQNDLMDDLNMIETILLQPPRELNNNNFHSERRSSNKCFYLFKSMLEAQECLEALDFLESIKYANNLVNPRQILTRYLYSSYDFSTCISSLHTLHQKETDAIHILHPEDLIAVHKDTLTFPQWNIASSYVQSIRTHITKYLTAASTVSDNAYGQLGLAIKSLSSSGSTKKSFVLPLYETFTFLLLFTFYDARDFSNINPKRKTDKLPPHNSKNKFSDSSYELVLQKLSDLRSDAKKEIPYVISTLYCCDKIFHFQKMNRLQAYYNMYQSDYILEKIRLRYPLSGDTENLKNAIIQNIFGDNNFIVAGLKSRYLDFMLPFNLYFLCTLHVSPFLFHDGYDMNAFISKLTELKDKTLQVWKISPPTQCLQNMFHFEANGDFSIVANEQNIIKTLQDNSFYKEYYINAPIDAKLCIGYDTLKAAMDINFDAF